MKKQPKICTTCGKEYRRRECEYCTRKRKWEEEVEAKEKLRLFSKRIIRDLESASIDDLSLVNDLEKLKDVGGLFLTGKVGTGKTIYAACLTLEACRRHYVNRELKWRDFEFISTVELLQLLKESYGGDSSCTEKDVIDKYSECDWLVLDDLGVERVNEWVFQTFYLIINRRYENLKSTIFTSNLNLEQLAEKLGDDRIPARIGSMCEIKRFQKVLRKSKDTK